MPDCAEQQEAASLPNARCDQAPAAGLSVLHGCLQCMLDSCSNSVLNVVCIVQTWKLPA